MHHYAGGMRESERKRSKFQNDENTPARNKIWGMEMKQQAGISDLRHLVCAYANMCNVVHYCEGQW